MALVKFFLISKERFFLKKTKDKFENGNVISFIISYDYICVNITVIHAAWICVVVGIPVMSGCVGRV